MLQASELRSTGTLKMEIFIAGVNHAVKNTSVVLLTKLIYRVPSKIPTKISDSFPASPWFLQASAEIVPLSCQYHYCQSSPHVTIHCYPAVNVIQCSVTGNIKSATHTNTTAMYLMITAVSTYLPTYLPNYLPNYEYLASNSKGP